MQAEFGDQVKVVGVAGRDDASAMIEFVEKLGVTGFSHVIDSELDVWGEYGIRSQPAFAFLNDDGSFDVHSGSLGAEGLTQRIEALLAS